MEWISVKDRLPEKEQRVLAYGKDWIGVGVCFMSDEDSDYNTGDYCWRWSDDRLPVLENNVTLWSPFPEPPKQD